MLLVLILFGITTFGWMFYQDNNWETAAREAARRFASGDALEVGSPVTCDSAGGAEIFRTPFTTRAMSWLVGALPSRSTQRAYARPIRRYASR